MHAEFNDWSVAIYSDGKRDVPVLKRIMDTAREQKSSCGSVGVIPLPSGCKKSRRKSFVFVSLLHCDKAQAKEIFRLAGVNTNSIPLSKVGVVWQFSSLEKLKFLWKSQKVSF